MARKQPGQRFFLVLNLFYNLQRGSRENYHFPWLQPFPGGPTFSRGGGGGGVQMLISIETHISCEFPGGSGPPIPTSST